VSRQDRDREAQRARLHAAGLTDRGLRRPPAPPPPPRAAGPSLLGQLRDAPPAELALLVVRAFFGITFIYAGIDKLVDPAFFDASSPTGIVAQLDAFTQASPLAPIITLMAPFAIPIGLLIALGEIAVGVGALTGLAFRLAATGGAALSLLFWLTASWHTQPYYYGPDLPYAIGWIALAIAGHGGLLVPAVVRRLGEADDHYVPDPGVDATRRLLLQAGALGAVAIAVASLSVPLRAARGSMPAAGRVGSGESGGNAGGAGQTAGAGPTSSVGQTPAQSQVAAGPAGPAGSFTPTGLTLTTTAAVDAKGAVRVRIPANAPGSLPGGDPAIIVRLQDGTYAAYDAVCTHEGCKVGWDAQDQVMLCPCHGAAFDPNDHGAVLQGPTRTPLPELPLDIDGRTGAITLRA
jgi:thiosulfate dehydrogenase [quinone] large subunit